MAMSKPNDIKSTDRTDDPRANPDPITKAPGSHPVGTGVGAAVGGAAGIGAAAATGAAIGAAVGPAGAMAGAAIGAVAGGLIGKGVAENINPTLEHKYWRDTYTTRPYVDPSYNYDDDYGPAYQAGWESWSNARDRDFDDIEPELASRWDQTKGKSRLTWDRARDAARDSWQRVKDAASDRSDEID